MIKQKIIRGKRKKTIIRKKSPKKSKKRKSKRKSIFKSNRKRVTRVYYTKKSD